MLESSEAAQSILPRINQLLVELKQNESVEQQHLSHQVEYHEEPELRQRFRGAVDFPGS